MRNVTITMDDGTAHWVRVEAARADVSMSRFIGDLLRHRMVESEQYQRAMQSYLSRPAARLGQAGQRYPTRDEVHER